MSGNKKSPVGIRLKEARTAAGYSQKSLGIAAGMDRFVASARMNQYETDKHIPDYETVKKIAKVLKVPPAYFYCEDKNLAELLMMWQQLNLKTKKSLIKLAKQELHGK